MAVTPNYIADALSRVQAKTDAHNGHIIQTSEMSRADRENLVATGWLEEIIRGWYMLVQLGVAEGDTAAWYANFWDFIRIYLDHRFGNEYCLSTESSLDLHIENPTIPKQVIVIVNEGAGLTKLKHDTSLMIYNDPKNFPSEITRKLGINVMKLPFALCKATPSYFRNNPRDAEIALKSLTSIDELTQIISRYNFKTSAARLIGAYQFLRDQKTANEIENNLKKIGIIVNPTNPFAITAPLLKIGKLKSPYLGRITAMWEESRQTVVKNFPSPPGLPKNKKEFLYKIDEIYTKDAYNSLSIEGYRVTPELINKIKNQQWDPQENEFDNNTKNGMAAKGYYDSFQAVKSCISQIIKGKDSARIVEDNLQSWYQLLFGPAIKAGIIPAESLFGYRNAPVYLKNSRHTPPSKEAVPDAMEAFFECLKNEPHPGVRAVLAHYFFVYIHPYMDGNGRLGRFLMNAFLTSGGYPWTIVRVDQRTKYIDTLENTHTSHFDMTNFTKFIAAEMNATDFNDVKS